MELKDVIHFYLGAEAVMTEDFQYHNYQPHISHKKGSTLKVDASFLLIASQREDFKYQLKLRPLSSMTEDEIREAWDITNKGEEFPDDAVEFFKEESTEKGFNGMNFADAKAPMVFEFFTYLLSIGIDCFNLIESGQAIEAEKLIQ